MTVSPKQIAYGTEQGFNTARIASNYSITFQPMELSTYPGRQGLVTPLSRAALKMFVPGLPKAGTPDYVEYIFPAVDEYPAGVVIPKLIIDSNKYQFQSPNVDTVATASVYTLAPGASARLSQDPSTIAAAHLPLASFMPNGQPRFGAGALEIHASNDRHVLGLPVADFTNLMAGRGIAQLQVTHMTDHDAHPEGWQVSNPTQFEQLFAVIEAADLAARLALNALNAQAPTRAAPAAKLPKKQQPSRRSAVNETPWGETAW